METIIVSACLLGDKTRYDGKSNYNPKIELIKENYDIIPICPEVMGGMKIPREPTELKNGLPYSKSGKDVNSYFLRGTKQIINIVKYKHITKAILVEKSPSCGVHQIHNGLFNGGLIDGEGYATKELKNHKVDCYTLDEFIELFLTKKED